MFGFFRSLALAISSANWNDKLSYKKKGDTTKGDSVVSLFCAEGPRPGKFNCSVLDLCHYSTNRAGSVGLPDSGAMASGLVYQTPIPV